MDIEPNETEELGSLRRRLSDLLELLRAFHADHSQIANDEVLRFEMLCDRMFNTFVFKDGSGDSSPSVPVSNLDTGDALPRPFPPFVRALQQAVEQVALDAHHYYQPGSIESLTEAALLFLDREGFPIRRPLSDLQVLPGAGTTQIFDALCKVHVESPADTVLVPELGYGFFLTQPGRIGGRVAAAPCNAEGAVSAAGLSATINEENMQLWREWKIDSEALFHRAVRTLSKQFRVSLDRHSERAFADLHRVLATAPNGWRSNKAFELLASAAPQFTSAALCTRAIGALRPPRVVALLHIQPSVAGHIYTKEEVGELAKVLDRDHVAAIEDIAYHSIRCRLRDLASLQGTADAVYTMVGVSKPMAIANLRLGLLFVDNERFVRANRAIESTASYVSALLQRVLAASLAADGFDDYVTDMSWGPAGYENRERVMHRLLTGELSDLDVDVEVRKLLQSIVAESPRLEPFTDGLLNHGMTRWFRPVTRPTAGFFYVVSCAPLLALAEFRKMGISSSFDVFALLAYLFDLRTIPEEGMRPGGMPGTRLRIAFSPDSKMVARLMLYAFAGLTIIERDSDATELSR